MKKRLLLIIVCLIILIMNIISCSGKEENINNNDSDEDTKNIITTKWEKIKTKDTPQGRKGMSMTYIGNDDIFIFGGTNNKSTLNETFRYNIKNKTFEKLSLKGDKQITEDVFASKYHATAYNGDNIIVKFGGTNEANPKMNITWEYIINKNEWKMVFTDGLPPKRHSSAICRINDNELLMFGGQTGADQYLDDLWKYDIESNKWSKMNANENDDNITPAQRAGHSLVSVNNTILMYGGITTNNVYLDELWQYDIDNNKWELLFGSFEYDRDNVIAPNDKETNTNNNSSEEPELLFLLTQEGNADKDGTETTEEVVNIPMGRAGHSTAVSEESGVMYLFGGVNNNGELNDLWQYDVDNNEWTILDDTEKAPQKRSSHGMIYDAGNNKLIMFGGEGQDNILNDTWEYTLD